MFRLDQQVGGETHRVGTAVGDHDALGRAEQHHRRHAVALHLDLGERHGRRSGTDDHPHLGDRLRAETHGGDTGRPIDAEHVGDPELAAHDEHRRVDRPVGPAWDRGHDENDLGDPGDDSRGGQLVGDARVAGLARRYEEAGRGDRGQLLADDEAGFGLEAPVGEAGELVLAEARGCARWRRRSPRRPCGGTVAASISAALTRSWSGARVTPSKRARASQTASSPRSRTSSISRPIDWRSSGSKMASRPRPTQRRPRRRRPCPSSAASSSLRPRHETVPALLLGG